MSDKPLTLAALRGALLNPQPDGSVTYLPDATILFDTASGIIVWVGATADVPREFRAVEASATQSAGLLLPPFLDLHTHLPQFPIRGRFAEGIEGNPPEGRLLAGLQRNVFPEEARHRDTAYATGVFRDFYADALSHGVVGGVAFGTVHADAARAALETLPPLWSVGLVLMDSYCPEYLRTNEETLADDVTQLAEAFGPRFVPADRFAVCVTSPLRRRVVELAKAHGLRMQTHLNEQVLEKAFVERELYPDYESYTDIYRRDGLLDRNAIVAHCIQMTPPEWRMLADSGATVAHCPTSNTLLGSGTMPLDALTSGVEYTICTDVGASPTCSLLAEMAQFLKVHAGRSRRATPEEALYRTTLAPAQILEIDDQIGRFAPGMPLSYVEATLPPETPTPRTAAEAIVALLAQPSADAETATALTRLAGYGLPYGPDLQIVTDNVHQTAARLNERIVRVVVGGKTVFERVS